jgi:hypothetical protein
MTKIHSLALAGAMAGMGLLAAMAPATAANIIGLANNATSCGGSTLCSTNGTTGYSGTNAFDLSTINSWFQIDTNGVSHLAGQPVEPNGGSGDFLVVNDTGAVVTNFSLTLTDTFTASTPSVTCSGGVCTDNFQIHGGAFGGFTGLSLTGANCVSGCGTDSANFTSGLITYNWSGGSIAKGATFDLNFASWNNSNYASGVPEPATWAMFLAGFGGIGFMMRAARRKGAVATA